nr:hypothetical protein [Desulfovibrio desulfuricans]
MSYDFVVAQVLHNRQINEAASCGQIGYNCRQFFGGELKFEVTPKQIRKYCAAIFTNVPTLFANNRLDTELVQKPINTFVGYGKAFTAKA